jgi:hypothetical protein
MRDTIDIKSESDLTKDILFDLFDCVDGVLYWKKSPSNSVKAGAKAGNKTNQGYIQVKINRKYYKEHRLIFRMHNEYFPNEIDHINGVRDDNRIENLRPVTRSENLMNGKVKCGNTSGVKNVSWHKQHKKWRVSLGIGGKIKHICYSDDLESAKLEAVKARNQYFGEFANHG